MEVGLGTHYNVRLCSSDCKPRAETWAASRDLAEREGYVRTFVDEGAPMIFLLRATANQGNVTAHLRRVLAAVDKTGDSRPVHQGPIDRLSAREFDVLRLLETDLDGPEIARRLFVSLNTVRTQRRKSTPSSA
jgi:LuxR family transcriptional regulator, maltose regulon positive regulatory protein